MTHCVVICWKTAKDTVKYFEENAATRLELAVKVFVKDTEPVFTLIFLDAETTQRRLQEVYTCAVL